MSDALDPLEERLRYEAKKELRKRLRGLRNALPASAVAARSKIVCARIVATPAYVSARSIGVFHPIAARREVDLGDLVSAARAAGKRVAYPYIDDDTREMTLRFVSDASALEEKGLGFAEPHSTAEIAGAIDLVVVPALAVDLAGFRLGYGAGYYDRLLPKVAPPAFTIVVAFDFQLIAEVPTLAHDVAANLVITDAPETRAPSPETPTRAAEVGVKVIARPKRGLSFAAMVPRQRSLALFTDRYQLTMLAAYAYAGLAKRRAVFELFVRKLAPSRRYLIAAGIGRVLPALAELRFDDVDLAHLERDAVLGPAMAQSSVRELFEGFAFRAKVTAIPEGRVCFPGEPLVRVEGTLAEAQLVETLLLSVVNHDTRVASKCARIVQAAGKRPCFEFGSRRTHEHAAVDAARAAYIAGFAGTSNEECFRRYGVPALGTMAHAFLLAHAADAGEDGEARAFREFAETFASRSTFLVDTFDTKRGISRAISEVGKSLGGVRIDSGDLAAHAKDARAQLDAAGLADARVVLSDDLDEYRITNLLTDGATVDAFGVGTMAVTTPDTPSLGAVYKLVAIEDANGRLSAVQKRSPGKGSAAGTKQVFRKPGTLEDTVALASESIDGEPLLVPMLDDGRILAAPSLSEARERVVADLARADERLKSLSPRPDGEGFPVRFSERLLELFRHVEQHGRADLG